MKNRLIEMKKQLKRGTLKYLYEDYVTRDREGYYDSRTTLNQEGSYSVRPIAESNTQYYIICPYCKQIHVHGNSNSSGCLGYRIPHCNGVNNYKEYEIVK